jgi:hypothetical protein
MKERPVTAQKINAGETGPQTAFLQKKCGRLFYFANSKNKKIQKHFGHAAHTNRTAVRSDIFNN